MALLDLNGTPISRTPEDFCISCFSNLGNGLVLVLEVRVSLAKLLCTNLLSLPVYQQARE